MKDIIIDTVSQHASPKEFFNRKQAKRTNIILADCQEDDPMPTYRT